MDKTSLRLPACLIIMDGFGLAPASESNAISLANTPVLDDLFANHPFIKLEASGEAVGLPCGQMGNSEVGHLNIGAGRIVYQELTRINQACDDGSISTNPVLCKAFDSAAKNGCALHLMGLLSDGGVHSNNKHLYALIEAAVKAGVRDIYIHCFMDGRDVAPTSGIKYLIELQDKIKDIEAAYEGCNVGIGSIEGRYFAMDRDKRWDRVEKAYEAIVCPGTTCTESPDEALRKSYDEGITDEFFVPTRFSDRPVEDGDVVVFFNFRPDRAREITRSIVDGDFDGFQRKYHPKVDFVCLTEYDPSIKAPVAFEKSFPDNVLADVLAMSGLSQYHIAETEKYAHVTFFLNGGIEEEKSGEIRKLIPSPKVATYDLQPEMSEPEVADTLSNAIKADEADVYIVNFANCDMVGHTGVLEAAKAAVEAVDAGVGKVVDAIAQKQGVVLVTADHGNADKMFEADGSPHTAHTTALVPLVLVDYSDGGFSLEETVGKLSDIAPTFLSLIGIPVPPEMTGDNLLVCE